MKLNLYPYNYWILWASCLVLALCLVILVSKALNLVKQLKVMQAATEPMQKNLKLMQIKTEAVNEKKAEQQKKNKLLMAAIPILLAVQKAYSADDELHGVKGYTAAAKKVYKTSQDEKTLIAKIKKAM